MYCKICKKQFFEEFTPICPFCGTDSRNPIEYTYSENERYLIKNELLYNELLFNLKPELFIIEIMNRNEVIENINYNIGTKQYPPYSEFNYFQGRKITSLVDIKYDYAKKVLNRNFSKEKIDIDLALWGAVREIAFYQISQIRRILYARDDYEFIQYSKTPDYLWDLRIELKNIKKEKILEWKKHGDIKYYFE